MAENKEVTRDTEYISDFEFSSDTSSEASRESFQNIRDHTDELYKKPVTLTTHKVPRMQNKYELLDNERKKNESFAQRGHLLSMDAYTRHKKLVNDYLVLYNGAWNEFKRDESGDRRDLDIIKENHRFLWRDGDTPDSWGARLAKRYWEKLFKEYCIVDLSRYKENKMGMRWRLEKEVVAGRGQFICGNKRCEENTDLRSWEVNFAYVEQDEKRNALVKLRLCPECSVKLNYHHRRKEVTRRPAKRPHDVSPVLDDEIVDKVPRAGSSPGGSPCSSRGSSGGGDRADTPPLSAGGPGPICTDEEVWRGPAPALDKSREDEFQDYFEDMFL